MQVLMSTEVEFEILVGSKTAPLSDTLAQMRLDTFIEFPHLYVGDIEYEKTYAQSYLEDSKTIMGILKVDGKIVGIASGSPLNSASEICNQANTIFDEHGLDYNEYYYLAEAVILNEYRGNKFLNQYYPQIEEKIMSLGFKKICFLSITDKDNHPLKPKNYTSFDHVWKRLGYNFTNMKIDYNWPTIQFDGSTKDEKHTLVFWIKDING